MVVIRLARGGSKKTPFFHVVVADSRKPRDGRFIEKLGYFDPRARGQAIALELSQERVDHWINNGAQPSERVANLLKTFKKAGSTTIKADAPTSSELRKSQAENEVKLHAEKLKKEAAEAKKAEAEAEKAKAAEEAEKAKAEADKSDNAEKPTE